MFKLDISHHLPLEDRQSVSVDAEGTNLFLVQFDGELYAYENHCPHLGVELNWMPDQFLESGGDMIICSTHGALFRIQDGHCVSGPCQGDELTQRPVVYEEKGTFILLPEPPKDPD